MSAPLSVGGEDNSGVVLVGGFVGGRGVARLGTDGDEQFVDGLGEVAGRGSIQLVGHTKQIVGERAEEREVDVGAAGDHLVALHGHDVAVVVAWRGGRWS